MAIGEAGVTVDFPMERPLFNPPLKVKLASGPVEAGEANLDTSGLFDQIVVDRARLAAHIQTALGTRTQVTLGELVRDHPLEHGLAELVGYLWLATEGRRAVIDEANLESITWTDTEQKQKRVELPRVIFVRSS